MKKRHKRTTEKAKVAQAKSDSSKLASLLALAAGAAAVPQTGNAAIIVNTTSGFVLPGSPYLCSMPGTARLQFHATSYRSATFGGSVHKVSFNQTAGYVRIRPAWLDAGVKWGQNASLGSVSGISPCATARNSLSGTKFNPGSFSDKYLSFEFQDSTAGNALRYGWIEVSLQNGPPGSGYPFLTVDEWAYENTGVQIATGQTTEVPEPSSVALLALGALACGAKGIRRWRGSRPAPTKG